MKAEPPRSTAGRSIQSLETSDKSTSSEPTASGEEETTNTAPSAAVEAAHPIEERAPDTTPPVQQPPTNTEAVLKSPARPMPPKPTEMAKPAAAGKAVISPKSAADKISPPIRS